MDNHQAALSLVEQEGEEVTACMKAEFDLLLTGGKLEPAFSARELGICRNAMANQWLDSLYSVPGCLAQYLCRRNI